MKTQLVCTFTRRNQVDETLKNIKENFSILNNKVFHFKSFDTRLQTLGEQTEQSTQPIAKLGEALAACERGSADLASVLNSLSIDSKITQSLNESVQAISGVFQNFSISVQSLENDFGTNSQQSSTAFRQFNESLVISTQLLSQSMNQLALAMAESSKTLSSSIRDATSNATEK